MKTILARGIGRLKRVFRPEGLTRGLPEAETGER